jgi:NADH:ubiquinone reductase (non-electrogenic)
MAVTVQPFVVHPEVVPQPTRDVQTPAARGSMVKRRIVILGGGFAAVSALRKIDLRTHDVTLVSSRNHFLFTPLLPSTTVGTIEFRSIIEPLRKVRAGVRFMLASAKAVDFDRRVVRCHPTQADPSDPAGQDFELSYDLLVIAVGAWNNTFDVPGVKEHALFLKELADARAIREKIVACLERASVPGVTDAERQRLLHFVVVGGGPTGVEFAAELNDLLHEDLRKSYPELIGHVRVTLFEAGKSILNQFDATLRDYTARVFGRHGIALRTGTAVAEVGDGFIRLKDGEVVPCELVVWSTGYVANSFVQNLPLAKNRVGRLLVDGHLRVVGHDDVYAMGDCAVPATGDLPQTAQAAMQQGKYLAKALNARARGKTPKPFAFKNLGMLAYIGESEALAEIPAVKVRWRGVLTYLFWRSAYLTRLVRLKNKVLVAFDWLKTRVFGRDLSRF